MKFATTSIIAAAILAFGASAKTTSDVVTNPAASPTKSTTTSTSSGIGTATKPATITVPIMTTITTGVPTVISTTVAPSRTLTTLGRSAGNAIQAPVKSMMAIGGVAALAQFF